MQAKIVTNIFDVRMYIFKEYIILCICDLYNSFFSVVVVVVARVLDVIMYWLRKCWPDFYRVPAMVSAEA